MNKKSFAGLFLSILSVLGINFIPLEMWLYRDFSGEHAMILYALETIVAVSLAFLFVLFFAPKREIAADGRARRRAKILKDFATVAFSFSFFLLFFLVCCIVLIVKAEISLPAIFAAMIWIFGFQILEFIGDFIMLRPLSLAATEEFLTRSLGRIPVLFFGIFIGFFLAAFVEKWFILPFIILKTIVDIAEQIHIFTGIGGKPKKSFADGFYIKS